MAGYLGASPVPQTIQKKQSFTATASQTTFTTTGYTDGAFINVYLNGVRLINGTDYTATNGSDIVLTSAASASDVLDFETFNEFTLVDQTLETPTFTDSATVTSTTTASLSVSGDTTATLSLKNNTHEDTDGGRESTLIFKGEQSGGEISTLAEIEASHDGTADDEKGDLIFRTNDGSDGSSPTEAARIDSAQNLLVGKTSNTFSDTGVALNPDGSNNMTRDGNPPLALNRLTSDGDILGFYKDGTSVGSVGVRNGDFIYIANADSDGFALQDNAFRPSSATGSNQDNAIDLGTTTSRFKDLYLSGGAYIGGTAAANQLDDYEEGSWTPNDQSGAGLSFTTHYAKYVKIGKQVTVHLYLTYPSTSNGATASIGGLPFAVESSGYAALFINCSLGAFCAQVQQSTTRLNIKNATNVHQLNSTLSSQFIIFSGSYVVA